MAKPKFFLDHNDRGLCDEANWKTPKLIPLKDGDIITSETFMSFGGGFSYLRIVGPNFHTNKDVVGQIYMTNRYCPLFYVKNKKYWEEE